MQIWDHFIRFKPSTPHYYLAVYLQLIIVTPVLIGAGEWCKSGRWNLYKYVVTGLIILIVCYLTTHFTKVLDVIYGGEYLFGGPWMLFWTIGIFIGNVKPFLSEKYRRTWVFIAYTIILIVCEYLFIIKDWNSKFAPIFYSVKIPYITVFTLVETVLLFFWIKMLAEKLVKLNAGILKVVSVVIDYVGRRTLYIFLYHILFLDIWKTYGMAVGMANPIGCLILVFGGPLVVEFVLSVIKRFFIDYIIKDMIIC